jgi:hypothetical protein
MSTRERWLIYPLLFLTLGIVMRDKFFPQGHIQANELTAGRIHCGQLQVDRLASAGGIAVRDLQCSGELAAGKLRCSELRADQLMAGSGLVVRGIQCSEVVVVGPNGRPTVLAGTDARTKGGLITTLSSTGTPLVWLQPTDSGGAVRAAQIVQGKIALPETPNTPSTPKPKSPPKQPKESPTKTAK